MLEIIRIPAFTDNYIWLLVNTNTNQGAVIDPDNEMLIKRFHEAKRQRANQMATVPSTLSLELQTNPFLRTGVSAVINTANQYSQQNLSKESDIFLAIRQRKDKFSN
jgi:hydroxyacylglutathione hydrolase